MARPLPPQSVTRPGGRLAGASPAEDLLALELDVLGIPYERQYRYVPGRRLRADFAILGARLLIEVVGGVYSRQAHGSIRGVLADVERLNQASMWGWRMLRVLPQQVEDGSARELVLAYLRRWAPGLLRPEDRVSGAS